METIHWVSKMVNLPFWKVESSNIVKNMIKLNSKTKLLLVLTGVLLCYLIIYQKGT